MKYCFLIISLFLILSAGLFAEISAADKDILIGLIPEENIFVQMDRHRPLAEYMSRKLGRKVRFTILSRYGDVFDRFMSRKMDGAFFGVFTGALAMEKLDAEPIVHPVNMNGTFSVQSYVFVRKDSGIKRINDMKGKRIVFVDRATVTGYLYALSYLRENGVVNPGSYFREVSFTGSHGSTINAVLDGRADIGTAKSRIFDFLVRKDPGIKEELNIIAKSFDFPDSTLFLRKDLPQTLRSEMRRILMEMDRDEEGKNILKKLEAQKFIEAKKSDFRSFYNVADKAGITLKNYRYR